MDAWTLDFVLEIMNDNMHVDFNLWQQTYRSLVRWSPGSRSCLPRLRRLWPSVSWLREDSSSSWKEPSTQHTGPSCPWCASGAPSSRLRCRPAVSVWRWRSRSSSWIQESASCRAGLWICLRCWFFLGKLRRSRTRCCCSGTFFRRPCSRRTPT